jgi:hypothetical protein
MRDMAGRAEVGDGRRTTDNTDGTDKREAAALSGPSVLSVVRVRDGFRLFVQLDENPS